MVEFVEIPNLTTRNCATWFKEIVVANLHLFHNWLSLGIFSSNFINNTSFFFNDIMLAKCDGTTSSINECTRVNYATITKIYLSLKLGCLTYHNTWRLSVWPTWSDSTSGFNGVWRSSPCRSKSGSVRSSFTWFKCRSTSFRWSAWLTLHCSSRSIRLHCTSRLISLHRSSGFFSFHCWASVSLHLIIDIWF